MKPSTFENRYLKRDDEFDLVLKTSPCTFLANDNSCSIYETRPRACSEYPHTNRKKMAKMPKGAKLIYNPSSSAPGFYMKNVFVLPHVTACKKGL